jgi:hypothetical protein
MFTCFIYWIAADLKIMMQTCSRMLNVSQSLLLSETVAHGHYFQGIGHYHRNELQKAEQKLAAATMNQYAYHGINFIHSSFALARTYQALELPGQAKEVSESFDQPRVRDPGLAGASVAQ